MCIIDTATKCPWSSQLVLVTLLVAGWLPELSVVSARIYQAISVALISTVNQSDF